MLWVAGMQLGLFYNLRYTGMSRRQKLRVHILVFLVTRFAGVIDTAGPLVAVLKWLAGIREVAWKPTPKLAVEPKQQPKRVAVAEKQEEEKDLPRGDAKRVADLDRLAAALRTYREQHGGYPVSTGTCAGGSFDSDADLGFLADLEREAVVNAIPRNPVGITKTTEVERGTDATANEDCDTTYGAKHYLHYSNGTKFALIASVDEAIPDDAAAVYLAEGDREWFDGSALIADWHWSRNVYIVSNQKLAEAKR